MNLSWQALEPYIGHSQAGGLVFVVLAAAATFVLCLGVASFLAAIASPVRRRLAQLGGGASPATSLGAQIAQRLRPVADYVLPTAEAERSQIEKRFQYAGLRSPYALPVFYVAKLVLIVTPPCLVLAAAPLFPQMTTEALLFYAFSAALIGFVLPSMWLDHAVKSRQRELRTAFPDALDLLVVCVEAGLGLAPALQRVAEELSVSHPELGDELARVNAEMRAGVERTQALRNLAERTGLSDIRGLVALMVQTMRFGTSVADALRVYSEEFRDKRMQAAEEQAAKIGTKMIFPLIVCLFPSFFLVAVGPAVLRLMDVFGQLRH